MKNKLKELSKIEWYFLLSLLWLVIMFFIWLITWNESLKSIVDILTKVVTIFWIYWILETLIKNKKYLWNLELIIREDILNREKNRKQIIMLKRNIENLTEKSDFLLSELVKHISLDLKRDKSLIIILKEYSEVSKNYKERLNEFEEIKEKFESSKTIIVKRIKENKNIK